MRQSPLTPILESLIVRAVEKHCPDLANEVLPERHRPAKGDRPRALTRATSPSRADRVNVLVERRKAKLSLWHPDDELPPDMEDGYVEHEQGRNGSTHDLGAVILGHEPPEDDE